MPTTEERIDALAELWPLADAHWSAQDVREALIAAGELVRYANRATLTRPQLLMPYGSDLYDVLAPVRTLISRLPQLLDQLAARAETFSTDTSLVVGEGPEAHSVAAEEALEANAHLRAAALSARRMCAHADEALIRVGHLGHTPDEP